MSNTVDAQTPPFVVKCIDNANSTIVRLTIGDYYLVKEARTYEFLIDFGDGRIQCCRRERFCVQDNDKTFVRCVDAGSVGATHHKIYELKGTDEPSPNDFNKYYKITNDFGNDEFYFQWRFVIVSKPLGDKPALEEDTTKYVTCIDADSDDNGFITVGNVYKVIRSVWVGSTEYYMVQNDRGFDTMAFAGHQFMDTPEHLIGVPVKYVVACEDRGTQGKLFLGKRYAVLDSKTEERNGKKVELYVVKGASDLITVPASFFFDLPA